MPLSTNIHKAQLIENRIPYNYIRIDNTQGEQRSEWYTKINPNGRLPAVVHVKEDGNSVVVWESAACMLYIVTEFDKGYTMWYPPQSQDYWQMLAWVRSLSLLIPPWERKLAYNLT